MKKLIILLAVPLILLCGCTAKTTDTASAISPVIINLPKDNTVNGYRKTTPSGTSSDNGSMPDITHAEDTTVFSGSAHNQNENSKEYCGNKNSKVFHLATCGSVTGMKDSNKVYFKDRNEFVSNGYKPCGRCKP